MTAYIVIAILVLAAVLLGLQWFIEDQNYQDAVEAEMKARERILQGITCYNERAAEKEVFNAMSLLKACGEHYLADQLHKEWSFARGELLRKQIRELHYGHYE